MASQESRAGGEEPEQMVTAYKLVSIPPPLSGQLWQTELVVVGLRVCKQLLSNLLAHCTSILLVQNLLVRFSQDEARADLNCLPSHVMVTLKLKG